MPMLRTPVRVKSVLKGMRLHVSVGKEKGHLRKDCKNPSGNKGLHPGLCSRCGEENLGGMNVNQSSMKMGLHLLKKQVK